MVKNNSNTWILIGLFALAIIGAYNWGYEHAKAKYNIGENGNVILPDTTYNKVRLDSIKSDIVKYDSTLYELNIKTKEDVKKVYMLSDSASVELLKQLLNRADTTEL